MIIHGSVWLAKWHFARFGLAFVRLREPPRPFHRGHDLLGKLYIIDRGGCRFDGFRQRAELSARLKSIEPPGKCYKVRSELAQFSRALAAIVQRSGLQDVLEVTIDGARQAGDPAEF
jgi:hypothetical protein